MKTLNEESQSEDPSAEKSDELLSEPEKESTSQEESSDEECDEEPKLKYQRLPNVSSAITNDTISTMGVSDRFLALGTHSGKLKILDFDGNDVKKFDAHSATINQISIDTNGEYVCSSSDDGKIAINSLYSSDSYIFNYKRPVKACALEPDYSKKSTKQYCSGGMAEYLTLSGKGWFGNTNVVIHSGEGPIYTIQWRGIFIAWANEAGVKIYDTVSQQKFAYLNRPPGSPRADLFKCNLCWKSDEELLIGWADSVKIGRVKERSKIDIASGMPKHSFEITFKTDYVVSGIAPLNDDLIVLLVFLANAASESQNVNIIGQPSLRKKSKPPEIHVVDYMGNLIANDVLSLTGYEKYNANDYKLEYLPAINSTENSFYLISPKDIIIAKPRDIDDHIQWLVERKEYKEAMRVAEEEEMKIAATGITSILSNKVKNIVEIGQKWLTSLIYEGRFEEAASNCPNILRKDCKLWEKWFFSFAEAKQLPSLHATIKSWPADIYNLRIVINAVEDALQRYPNNESLMETLFDLYARSYLLRKPNVLALIRQFNLYQFLCDSQTVNTNLHLIPKIPLLFDYIEWNAELSWKARIEEMDQKGKEKYKEKVSAYIWKIRKATEDEGVNILVEGVDRIPVSVVVEKLKKHQKYLHIYLDALFKKEIQDGLDYHNLQTKLYAEYDYPRLMDFLRTSSSYSIQEAFEICESRDLVPEMVFLLGKMGNNRKALMLIIDRLGDVNRAMEFCKDQNDEELWEDLLRYAMDKPRFIIGMLENLGAFVNPVRLVKRIPNGLEIPGLKEALIKVISDYSIQISLREGCEKILVNDTLQLLEQLYKSQKKALSLTGDEKCSICEGYVSFDGLQLDDVSILVFFCKHAFHSNCLKVNNLGSQNSIVSFSDLSNFSVAKKFENAIKVNYSSKPQFNLSDFKSLHSGKNEEVLKADISNSVKKEDVNYHSSKEGENTLDVTEKIKGKSLFCPICGDGKKKYDPSANSDTLLLKKKGLAL
ncbi:Vacuolar protein sorting-associated protein 41 [Clydaea vesicula]|uniref:Vacuolar protein sorting-associated protein 41 n=1 Tax=Clydaea vesicula TaxID=447962 RepID=A0AAD5TYT2_9FUNG|nr:Vacuolar protein sorting-associated protein 41 [Clydaea vesicula]